MATAMERRFTGLRKRLDQLGYRQPLGVESLPLVERLFGDLLHTTESLKNAKLQLGKHKEQKGLWDQSVEPYRQDNARLCKENCDLHQQLLRLKENSEAKQKDLKATLRRMEHESADLKFLNTQYLQRLLSREKESQAKTERILELQEKNMQAVVQTPGGRKKNIAFRRQRMEIDGTLPSNSKSVAPKQSLPEPELYVADLLRVADDHVADLKQQLKESCDRRKQLEQSLQETRKQVERRELEISRLVVQLKGGRPAEALVAEASRESQERMTAHLNIQVDYLQQANQELASQLKVQKKISAEAQGQVDDLSNKNSRICTELKEIGDLVKQMEQEREASETALQDQLETSKEKFQQAVKDLRESEKQRRLMEESQNSLMVDNRRMAELLKVSEGDSEQAADMLEKLNLEKKQLQRQCFHLKESECTLQQRVDELEERLAGHPSGRLSFLASPDVKRLRKERDELKETICGFETELMQIQRDAQMLQKDRDKYKLLYQQLAEETKRGGQYLGTADTCQESQAHLQQQVERERDQARQELSQLKVEYHDLRVRLQQQLQKQQQHKLTRKKQEKKEGDGDGWEDRAVELQDQLDEVLHEKSELQSRLHSLRDVVHSLEEELQDSTTALATSQQEGRQLQSRLVQLQAVVEASEKVRQQQRRNVHQRESQSELVKTESARLAARVRQLEQEVTRRDDRIEELGHALTMLDQDHDALRAECDERDERIVQMQQQLKEKAAECAHLDTLISQSRADIAASHAHLASKDKEIHSLRQQLDTAVRERDQSKADKATLEAQQMQLREDLATMTRENQLVNQELHKSAQHCEELGNKLHESTQSLLKCEEALAAKEQERAAVLSSYQALSEQAERLDCTVQQSVKNQSSFQLELSVLLQEKAHLEQLVKQQAIEIEQHLATTHSYEQQLASLTHALAKMEQSLRQAEEEKKALLADLSAMRDLCAQVDKNKDSVSRQLASVSINYEQLQSELTDLTAEKDLLKQQLAVQMGQVETLQALLAVERRKEFNSLQVEKEKETELQHVRQRLDRLENDKKALDEQVHKLHSEAVVRREEVKGLRTELAGERYQKEHIQQQMNKLRSAITTSPTITLTTSQSPKLSSSFPVGQTQPTISSQHLQPEEQQQTDSPEVASLIAKEQQTLASESARVVDQLLSSSSSSSSRTLDKDEKL